MAISDILADSAADMREYLKINPDWYEFMRPELDRLLNDMDALRVRLDAPPSEERETA